MPTKPAQPEPRTYHAHRDRQRTRILTAAEKLFDQQGIDRTTMAELIAASQLRTSTLYQYFSNKDDVVWALLGQAMETAALHSKKFVDSATTGLGKISALLDFMADELATNPSRVRFMAQFDAMYARDWPVERLLTLEGRFHGQGFQVFRSLIQEGIADGSLRPDLDPDLTLHAVMNAVIGAQRRLASLGAKVELEYGQPIDRLFRETIRILLFGLRATAQTNHTEPSPRAKTGIGKTKQRSS